TLLLTYQHNTIDNGTSWPSCTTTCAAKTKTRTSGQLRRGTNRSADMRMAFGGQRMEIGRGLKVKANPSRHPQSYATAAMSAHAIGFFHSWRCWKRKPRPSE